MGKTKLVKHISAETGITLKNVDKVIAELLRVIVDGEEVTIVGFGKFKWKKRLARQGTNPATGAPIEIPECRRLTFLASPVLRR